MKKNWKPYLFFLLLTEGTGALSALLTRTGTKAYQAAVQKPPLSPPPMVFPVVWSILFFLLAIGAARIFLSPPSPLRRRGLELFGAQLAFNFCWSLIFFNRQAFGLAFFWLLALEALIFLMVRRFWQVDRRAALLQIPYLLWVAFAGYLNFGVWRLNR